MTIKLVMKGRMGGGQWRDEVVLSYALDHLAQGKSLAKAALWMDIAGKIELAREEALEAAGKQPLEDFDVELSNKQARVMWKFLKKIPLCAYGRNPRGEEVIPPVGALRCMLSDIAAVVGGTMPAPDYDDLLDEGEDPGDDD